MAADSATTTRTTATPTPPPSSMNNLSAAAGSATSTSTVASPAAASSEVQWYFSQVKGTMEDEVNDADIISTVEFNEDGELLATGDKGGRIVIFQREQLSKSQLQQQQQQLQQSGGGGGLLRTEYNVYSTFQSHEAEFDYLKSLEIEEKINKIKWLKRKNVAHFLLSTNDKTVKLWKIRERNKKAIISTSASSSSSTLSADSLSASGGGLLHNGGLVNASSHVTVRDDLNGYIRTVSIPVIKYMDRIEVEAIPKRVFANAHTYHINSISLNSDQETFMSADDLRINLWHIEITNQSFNIVDIKPANMEELTEVITAAEFHPKECNLFVYSSSKGIIRLCDMRQSALCDTQAKIFEEREDPTTKNFFSEIISSISDVKFSHSGRYLCTRDYLNVKIWDLNMENRPVETYSVHDYLRNKLCILYENDCIFDKFECSWSSNDDHILSGSYNNFFKSFNRNSKQELMFECSREQTKPRQLLRPKRVVNNSLANGGQLNSSNGNGNGNGGSSPSLNTKRNNGNGTNMLNGKSTNNTNNNAYKDEVNVDNLDFTKKILHTSWHPKDNIIAIAATNNLYLYYNRETPVSSSSVTSAYSNCLSSSSSSSIQSYTTQTTTPTPPPPSSSSSLTTNANPTTAATATTTTTISSTTIIPQQVSTAASIDESETSSDTTTATCNIQQPPVTLVEGVPTSVVAAAAAAAAATSQITLNTSFYTPSPSVCSSTSPSQPAQATSGGSSASSTTTTSMSL